MTGSFPRPVPQVGDATSARERREAPDGWAFSPETIAALDEVIEGRRDIRRYRPDPVPDELVTQVVRAGHLGPSVGHSQPWRFIVVTDQGLRDRAAAMADRGRLAQAELLTNDRAARLLDLKLEGLREAPIGLVVACDRRTPATGVLGRATFVDADMWSCACAIENMWLTARAYGLGMGWVTLFEPAELAALLGLPEGVETLGWLCLGWPDERPPEPGLQRAAWSTRLPLEEVLLRDRWPEGDGPVLAAPVSHLRGPAPERLTSATDAADDLLAPPEALGVLDRALSRAVALQPSLPEQVISGGPWATLVLAAADHPVAGLGVSAYGQHVTRDVTQAAVAGVSMGAVAAQQAGAQVVVVDAGVLGGAVEGAVAARVQDPQGDLASSPALSQADTARLIAAGRTVGAEVGARGIVLLGEAGVGNTTPAAALAAALTGLSVEEAVGLGAGADAAIMERKREIVSAALTRAGDLAGAGSQQLLASLGGPEIAVLVGVVLGAVEKGAPVVLDGFATSVAAALAARMAPPVQAHLVAGHRSRERAHAEVLTLLGLEPLVDLRVRAGEGVGAALAAGMLRQGLAMRALVARTSK